MEGIERKGMNRRDWSTRERVERKGGELKGLNGKVSMEGIKRQELNRRG